MMSLADLDVILEAFYPTIDPELSSNDDVGDTIFAETDDADLGFDGSSMKLDDDIAEYDEVDLVFDGGEEATDISGLTADDMSNDITSTSSGLVVSEAATKEMTSKTLGNEYELPNKRPRLSHIMIVDDKITTIPASNTSAIGLCSQASGHPGEQVDQLTAFPYTHSKSPDPVISASSPRPMYPAVLSRQNSRQNPATTSVLDRRMLDLPKRPDVIVPGNSIVDRKSQHSKDQRDTQYRSQQPQKLPRRPDDPQRQGSFNSFSGGSYANDESRQFNGFGTQSPGATPLFATYISSDNVMPSRTGFRIPSLHRNGTFETSANNLKDTLPTNSLLHNPSPGSYIAFGTSASFNSGLSPSRGVRTAYSSHNEFLGVNASFGNGAASMNGLNSPQNLPNGPFDSGATTVRGIPVNTFQAPILVKPTTVKKQTRDVFTAVQSKKPQAKPDHASMNIPADSAWSFGNVDYRPLTRGKNKDDAEDRMSTEEFVDKMNQRVENWNRRNDSVWRNATNWKS